MVDISWSSLDSLHYAQRVTIDGIKSMLPSIQPFLYQKSHPVISDHPHVLALLVFSEKRGILACLLISSQKGKTKTGEEGNLYPLSIKQISFLCLHGEKPGWMGRDTMQLINISTMNTSERRDNSGFSDPFQGILIVRAQHFNEIWWLNRNKKKLCF